VYLDEKIRAAYYVMLAQAKKEDISNYTFQQVCDLFLANKQNWSSIDKESRLLLIEALLANDEEISEVNKRLFMFAVEYLTRERLSQRYRSEITDGDFYIYYKYCVDHLSGSFIVHSNNLAEIVHKKMYQLFLKKDGLFNQNVIKGKKLLSTIYDNIDYYLLASAQDLTDNFASRRDKKAFVEERLKWWEFRLRELGNTQSFDKIPKFMSLIKSADFWQEEEFAKLSYEIINSKTSAGFLIYEAECVRGNETNVSKR
jgi:hypothetical protein